MHSRPLKKLASIAATALLSAALLATPGAAHAAGSDPVSTKSGEPDGSPIPAKADVDERQVTVTDGVAQLARTEVAPFQMVGVTWDEANPPSGVEARIEVRVGGHWQPVEVLEESDDTEGRRGTDPLWLDQPADAISVSVTAASGSLKDVKVAIIDPGNAENVITITNAFFRATSTLDIETTSDGRPTTVPAPNFITRAEWGAGSGRSCVGNPTAARSSAFTLHHTAGSNSATKAQSKSIIRGYQTYHVNSRGWCDIGYNFLVDSWGQTFEGRGGGVDNQVYGAHSGVTAVNQHSASVAMMGTFESVEPSAAMKTAVVKLMGWRFAQHGVPAKGTVTLGGKTYQRIHGHRDAKSTACPGARGYAWMGAKGGLRDRVADYISNATGAETGDGGSTNSVQKLEQAASTTSTVTLSWEAYPEAAQYRIYVTPTPDMPSTCEPNCFVITPTNTEDPTYTLTELDEGTKYYVLVSALNGDGRTISGWQPTPLEVMTSYDIPSEVQGLELTANSDSTVALAWDAIPTAATYRVYVSPTRDMPSACEPHCEVVTVSDAANPSHVVTGLNPDTKYWVKISASGEDGRLLTGWQAEPLEVATHGVIPAAVEGLRQTSSTTTSVTLTWNAVPTAGQYRVYVSDSPTMPGACEPNCELIKPSNMANPSHTVTGLKPGTKYWIKVSGVLPDGGFLTGWQSSPVEVSTTSLPTIPSAVQNIRSMGASTNSIILTWDEVPTATQYRVYVTTSSSMPGKCEPNCQVITPANLSNPAHALTGLKAGTKYYVKISAINAAGKTITGWQSSPTVVETERAATPPTIPSTVQNIRSTGASTNSVNLAWDEVPTATRYRVYVTTSSSMPGKCEPNCQVITPANLSNPAHALTGLKAGTKYYVKISAINAAGKTITGWQSSPTVVETDGAANAPTTVQGVRQAGSTSTSVSLAWDAFPLAGQYRVYVSETPNMPGACEPNCELIKPSSLTSPSHTVTGLKPGTTYYVKISGVRANGGFLTGWQSAPVEVSTTGGTTIPSAVQNIRAANTTTNSINLAWDAVPTAQQYRVYVTETADMPYACEPNCELIRPANSSSPTHALTGLKPGTNYYVKISSVDSNGKVLTGWQSTPTVLKTAAEPAAPNVVQNIRQTGSTTSTVTLAWDRMPDAARYRVYVTPTPDMPSTCEPYCDVVTPSDPARPAHTVGGLEAGKTYYVKVSSMNSAGRLVTGWQDEPITVSTEDGATTIPSTVQGIVATSTADHSIDLSWDAVPTAARYRVYATTTPDMPSACEPNCEVVTPSSLASPSHTLTGLRSGTTYYIKVSSMNSAGRLVTGWQSSPYTAKTTGTPSSAQDSIAVTGSSVSFKGHGFGHGIGMSQHGAQGAAILGFNYEQILKHYYTGTTLGTRGGDVRVHITADTTDNVLVSPTSSLKFRNLATNAVETLPTSVAGRDVNRWSIEPDASNKRNTVLRYRSGSTWYTHKSWTGEGQFEGPTYMTLIFPNGDTVRYRGALRSAHTSSGSTNRDTVNVLSLEDYVQGVVTREMPASWRTEALKAQAVAARSYAARSMVPSRYYDICDTTSCQVYGGYSAETASGNAAVAGTTGKILMYNGGVATTQYSSSSGGWTKNGNPGHPYLKAVRDDWDNFSGNSVHNWTKSVSRSTIQGKYPAIGTLQSINVTKRNGLGDMGGRVEQVRLSGSKGSVTISGTDARWAFGLRSDWFGF